MLHLCLLTFKWPHAVFACRIQETATSPQVANSQVKCFLEYSYYYCAFQCPLNWCLQSWIPAVQSMEIQNPSQQQQNQFNKPKHCCKCLDGQTWEPSSGTPTGKKNTPHSQKSLLPYRQTTRKHNLCYKAQPLKTTSKTLMLFKPKKSQLQSHPTYVHFKPSLQKTSSPQHYNRASKRTY